MGWAGCGMYASNFLQGGQGFSRADFVLFLRSDRVQVCALGGVSRKSVPRRTREYGNTLCSPPTSCGPVAFCSYLITPSFRQSFECARTRTRNTTRSGRYCSSNRVSDKCQTVSTYIGAYMHTHQTSRSQTRPIKRSEQPSSFTSQPHYTPVIDMRADTFTLVFYSRLILLLLQH